MRDCILMMKGLLRKLFRLFVFSVCISVASHTQCISLVELLTTTFFPLVPSPCCCRESFPVCGKREVGSSVSTTAAIVAFFDFSYDTSPHMPPHTPKVAVTLLNWQPWYGPSIQNTGKSQHMRERLDIPSAPQMNSETRTYFEHIAIPDCDISISSIVLHMH